MSVDPLTTEYHTVDRLPEIRNVILDVYSEVYAQDIATDRSSRWSASKNGLRAIRPLPAGAASSRG
ncbi:hypothetical protein [Streptomyces uncialis]|uniref:hypothetical protein n=1 Tax=Streptomyces uncialis TaxID=1048205 RepID=UPI002254A165|nr:hypothetical protein [Streptomyces uncialis]MCX4663968.1 hypothetical protein [Streptomyces uncialis]